jgi:hypothetical protein
MSNVPVQNGVTNILGLGQVGSKAVEVAGTSLEKSSVRRSKTSAKEPQRLWWRGENAEW